MARRRRTRNPLLARILLISVVVHIIALPVLAKFGAFDKIRKAFGASDVVMITSATEPPKEKPPIAEAKKAQPQANVKKGGPNASRTAGVHHTNLNQPAVVAKGAGVNSPNAPSIEQGSGTAGQLPSPKNGGPGGAPQPTPTPVPTPAHHEDPTPQPTPSPTSKVPTPTPIPKKAPVYREVEPTYQPEPVIPDDLRQEALDKTCVVELTVAANGNVTQATVSQTSGNRQLDDLALKAAKTWRFRPASIDGEATEGKVRLTVEFKVE